MEREPQLGEIVIAEWARISTRGRVIEVYGPAHNRKVVLELTPEISGEDLYPEPTTSVFSLDELRPLDSAA